MTYDELKKKALENPAVKGEFDGLEAEFGSLRQMFLTRQDQSIDPSKNSSLKHRKSEV